MRKSITTTFILLILSACGGGDSESQKNTSTEMKLNTKYTIKKGQSIIKKSEKPQIILETTIETGETVAILKKGKATIE